MTVQMTCMTTKQKFEVENPTVVLLRNNRYAYRVECPWKGKSGQPLYAFKFCSKAAYEAQVKDQETGYESNESDVEIP